MVEDDRYCIEVLDQISAATEPCREWPWPCSTTTWATASPTPWPGGGDRDAKLTEASAAIARLVRA